MLCFKELGACPKQITQPHAEQSPLAERSCWGRVVSDVKASMPYEMGSHFINCYRFTMVGNLHLIYAHLVFLPTRFSSLTTSFPPWHPPVYLQSHRLPISVILPGYAAELFQTHTPAGPSQHPFPFELFFLAHRRPGRYTVFQMTVC